MKIEHICSFLFCAHFVPCIVQNVKDKKFLLALGNTIKQLRKKKKLSQLDVAVSMDNHPEQISRIERGLLNVTICTLKKIAEVLEVPISDLLPKT